MTDEAKKEAAVPVEYCNCQSQKENPQYRAKQDHGGVICLFCNKLVAPDVTTAVAVPTKTIVIQKAEPMTEDTHRRQITDDEEYMAKHVVAVRRLSFIALCEGLRTLPTMKKVPRTFAAELKAIGKSIGIDVPTNNHSSTKE